MDSITLHFSLIIAHFLELSHPNKIEGSDTLELRPLALLKGGDNIPPSTIGRGQ